MGGIGWGPKRIQNEVSASHYNDGRAKSHVGFVNPAHFLHATTPDDQRLNHIVDQAGQLDKEKLSKEGQSPFFRVDNGKIVAHEGRHRMSALARQGYTSVPVAVHYGQGAKLNPAGSVTLQPQFKGRDPVTVSNLVPLHHDYDDQINDMMKQQPEHFKDGGDVDGINNFVDDHSSAIADAMQNHFGVPVSVSKSKTAYGKSHYVKPNFDLPESETPFVVRVSDHAAWVPRLHQVEHHVYPKKADDPRKFIGESIEAATAYGKRRGLFPKDEFVPLSGKVVHPTFGEGTVLDSKPDVAKVDFGKNGVKNISARFLQPIHKADGGEVEDGITAYHGSPHDFDEFDTSKIGTGEGAQSYGHGLYFAGHEPVAKGYRDRLGKHEETSGETMADQHVIAPHFYKDMSEEEIGENMNNAAKWAEQRIFDQGKMKYLYEDGSMLIHDEDRVRAVQKQPGHMYEVHINAHPHHMLDWDKPLSEQPSHITKSLFDARKELPTLWEKTQHHINNDSTAGDFYQSIAAGHPHGYAGATEQLSRAGIKGIKYLDAGSRGDKAEPTHNYVVFDHKDVSVKRKYEQGGAVDGYANGGSTDMDNDNNNNVTSLGEVRDQRELQKFHKGFGDNVKESAQTQYEALNNAKEQGVYDGYDIGDRFLSPTNGPMKITHHFVRKYKPNPITKMAFDRAGAKPTIIEHEGENYIPMVRTESGHGDDAQSGDAYLDLIKHYGYPRMGGIKRVKRDGGPVGNGPIVKRALELLSKDRTGR